MSNDLKLIEESEIVYELLSAFPELRDSEERLIANVWKHQYGGNAKLKQMSSYDIIKDMSTGAVMSPRSISLISYALQKTDFRVRGKKVEQGINSTHSEMFLKEVSELINIFIDKGKNEE